MFLSKELCNRILTDNIFSLKVALYISETSGFQLKQHTLEHQVKRKSNKLLLPIYIDAYKAMGYKDEEIKEQ
ncbi:hypothetical protein MPN29_02590 [Riemerella anatipestifer]|uniref:hypothetical protein n=1 Tax=Riemerella anatipestifer TaxID=34085 RepID=UPI0007ECBB81|nr:hypothetical protein [Riemerella anatipestifer]MDD1549104.1 hypothetical protein [Riemerella anatipestifer]MDR7831926.1 hypothetical protein [Riemerella anatipestifer]MDY3402361.1 hypothetical protein [Riemerella anatipestifer]MRM84424.1 hypothetical protein [Riemerella anatipestifer]MRQ22241.1 hypothetical protein [Riemerella anatipestifer]